jgi:maltooligosyltrehalose trehalohydrolase
MIRKHTMPFGAECLPDGQVNFRLWAPEVPRIDLFIDNHTLPMPKTDSGWFELITDQASPGSRYHFVVNGKTLVPDPASRFQPNDVDGPSEVIDPGTFEWTDATWRGRPWEEAVIYELHVGAFSCRGTFAGVEKKLDYLVRLGVTAIELMPVSDFFGRRNWGYDGVLPYAPDSSYGHPAALKRLIQAAHSKGLMMLLDVVYNHFGPVGNYLRAYAPQFFTHRHHTPWGDGINFDGAQSRIVRDFFIHNALYWLEEFHFDGLRLDAVQVIMDDSPIDILTELAATVRTTLGAGRHIHLILENDDNAARYLRGDPQLYTAQWNDDIHHVCHVLASGESDGYYSEYTDQPIAALGKCLTEGFHFQGQPSPFRDGRRRGEISRQLPPISFISFLQNHDQVGNRAKGERIISYAQPDAVRALMAILLLAPSPPLLFMGEEFGAETPFLFFCDFEADLAKAVTDGRRAEFAKFAQFRDPATRSLIPDPNAESTFAASKLDWDSLQQPSHVEWLKFYSSLLALRQKEIVPFLRENGHSPLPAVYSLFQASGLFVQWKGPKQTLQLLAALGDDPIEIAPPSGARLVYATSSDPAAKKMPAWSAAWYATP